MMRLIIIVLAVFCIGLSGWTFGEVKFVESVIVFGLGVVSLFLGVSK